MAHGARIGFGAPCSNQRSFGSKCTVFKVARRPSAPIIVLKFSVKTCYVLDP